MVPPPIGDCPPLTQPVYRDGAWGCEDCEALVQYGSLFDFERVCTSLPRLVCPEGQVPTFDESLAHWVCARTCNNTTYDHAWIRGELVCVPC